MNESLATSSFIKIVDLGQVLIANVQITNLTKDKTSK